MFDVKKVEAEARQELTEERAKTAKGKIKTKLAQIDSAERVVANLREEYAVLLRDIGV
jgi:hypothetical protein